jgi:hypothetical protein
MEHRQDTEINDYLKSYPKFGDKRQRRGFLLLPKRIKGEWRWLRHAVWQQEYMAMGLGWRNQIWLDQLPK